MHYVTEGYVLSLAYEAHPSGLWAMRDHCPSQFADQDWIMHLKDFEGWPNMVFTSNTMATVIVPFETTRVS